MTKLHRISAKRSERDFFYFVDTIQMNTWAEKWRLFFSL